MALLVLYANYYIVYPFKFHDKYLNWISRIFWVDILKFITIKKYKKNNDITSRMQFSNDITISIILVDYQIVFIT